MDTRQARCLGDEQAGAGRRVQFRVSPNRETVIPSELGSIRRKFAWALSRTRRCTRYRLAVGGRVGPIGLRSRRREPVVEEGSNGMANVSTSFSRCTKTSCSHGSQLRVCIGCSLFCTVGRRRRRTPEASQPCTVNISTGIHCSNRHRVLAGAKCHWGLGVCRRLLQPCSWVFGVLDIECAERWHVPSLSPEVSSEAKATKRKPAQGFKCLDS